MTSLIIWSGVFILFNCLDIVTTYAGMGGLSREEMQDRELNPFASRIIHSRVLVWGVKSFFVVAVLVTAFIKANEGGWFYATALVQCLSVATFLVVINNIHATWAEKRGKLSLGKYLIEGLHLPKGVAYLLLVGCVYLLMVGLVGMGYLIMGVNIIK